MSAGLAAAGAEGSEQSRLPQSGFSPGPATGQERAVAIGCCRLDNLPKSFGTGDMNLSEIVE